MWRVRRHDRQAGGRKHLFGARRLTLLRVALGLRSPSGDGSTPSPRPRWRAAAPW
jgi:hypothetical protein